MVIMYNFSNELFFEIVADRANTTIATSMRRIKISLSILAIISVFLAFDISQSFLLHYQKLEVFNLIFCRGYLCRSKEATQ